MKPEDLIGEEGCRFVAKAIKEGIGILPVGIDWNYKGINHRINVWRTYVSFPWSGELFDNKEFDRFLELKSDPRFNADGFPIYAPTRERLQRYVDELREHQLNLQSQFYDVAYNVVALWDGRRQKDCFMFKSGAENSSFYKYTSAEIRACLEGRVTKQVVAPPVEYPLIFTEKELNDF